MMIPAPAGVEKRNFGEAKIARAKSQLLSSDEMVYWFVDIISKGGVMLMNLGPRADGSFAPQVKETALKMGEWMKLNAEGIYGTRPWLTYGEGPTEFNKGLEVIWGSTKRSEYGKNGKTYMWKDIRYTRSKDGKTLYAFTLGWPKAGEITLTRVKVDDPADGKVELIGHGKVNHRVNRKGQLVICIPTLKKENEFYTISPCFKISAMSISKFGRIPFSDDRLKRGDIQKWDQITPEKYDAMDESL